MAMQTDRQYDVLVIGGGPGGATAALELVRQGLRVLIVEKSSFPRFHVGESFLPRGFELLRELGLGDRLAELPHVPKFGAEFGIGDAEETTLFSFADSLNGEGDETFNIERGPFDAMVLSAACDAGAELRQGTVRSILRLEDGDVRVAVGDEEISARYLVDASGQATLVARHLGLRRQMPNHRKVAHFGHFEGVERLEGVAEGHPTVAMTDEGWFWMINIDERRTSIGMVLDADVARRVEVPASRMLAWGIDRCPLVRRRVRHAKFPETTHTVADFSYYCRPFAGPGYFLVGDAAFFLDPIFSSGLCLAMEGGTKAAALIAEAIARDGGAGEHAGRRVRAARAIRREYIRFIDGSAFPFVSLVNLFYDHSFRELFLRGQGPFDVHRAAISVLGGYVFPRPVFSLRWRLRLLALFARLQRFVPLVPRRATFSLFAGAAVGNGEASEFVDGLAAKA